MQIQYNGSTLGLTLMLNKAPKYVSKVYTCHTNHFPSVPISFSEKQPDIQAIVHLSSFLHSSPVGGGNVHLLLLLQHTPAYKILPPTWKIHPNGYSLIPVCIHCCVLQKKQSHTGLE